MIQVQIGEIVFNLTNANNIKFDENELTITVFYDGPKRVVRVSNSVAFENLKYNVLLAILNAGGIWAPVNDDQSEYLNVLNASFVEVKDGYILFYFQNAKIKVLFTAMLWAALEPVLVSAGFIKMEDVAEYPYAFYIGEDYVNYVEFADEKLTVKVNIMNGIERDVKMSSTNYATVKSNLITDLDPAVSGTGSGSGA
jgi:hypothetical protein